VSEASDGSRPALVFQFWDDHGYESYGPSQQELLRSSYAASPRPADVRLAGGRYVIHDFDKVELGRAFQVNEVTKKSRHLRLEPSCCADPSSPVAGLGEEFHFEFLDDEAAWTPFRVEQQLDLLLAARCRPLPQLLYFDVDGRSYQLLGLDSLADGVRDGMSQVFLRSGKQRQVRVVDGEPPEDLDNLEVGARLTRALEGKGPPNGPKFSRAKAVFRFIEHRTGCHVHGDHREEVDSTTRDALMERWIQPTLLDECELTDSLHVDNFVFLEIGGSRARRTTKAKHFARLRNPEVQWMQLVLDLPRPVPGLLRLPQALDKEEAITLEEYGRSVSSEDVAGLAARGSDAATCSICFCDVEEGGEGGSEGPLAVELRCGHLFHGECIRHWLREKRRCPVCFRDFGKIIGKQPSEGIMRWQYETFELPGHVGSQGSIVVDFIFPSGRDDEGRAYGQRRTRGYLPASTQGFVLLELFKVAFRRRVMFGLGHSMATEAYRPTFNIHIKTSTSQGTTKHGYPDETYFARAMEELATNGVTRVDLPP